MAERIQSVPHLLDLKDYRQDVLLDQPFVPLALPRPNELRKFLNELIAELRAEARDLATDGRAGPTFPDAAQELRFLLTQRAAGSMSEVYQAVVDQLLQEQRKSRGCAEASALPRMSDAASTAAHPHADRCALWRGDITTLGVDAIVNAANSEMLGCFRPFHACIDNAIHWAAGPRLRQDCGCIMVMQGYPEPAGHAKATRGYNLPSRFVLHTVGPIVQGLLNDEHEGSLAACYRACLDLAVRLPEVRTIAFCAISTGVFGYPKQAASRVALRTVTEWLNEHPNQLDLVAGAHSWRRGRAAAGSEGAAISSRSPILTKFE